MSVEILKTRKKAKNEKKAKEIPATGIEPVTY